MADGTSKPPRVFALTVGQPDAWCIQHGHRRLLNTKWHPAKAPLPRPERARRDEPDPVTSLVGAHVAIHAIERPERDRMRDFQKRRNELSRRLELPIPPVGRLTYDAIIAVARVVGCLEAPPKAPELARWWRGPHGLILEDVVPVLPPLACHRRGSALWPIWNDLVPVLRSRYRNGLEHLQREAARRARGREDDEERAAMMDPDTH